METERDEEQIRATATDEIKKVLRILQTKKVLGWGDYSTNIPEEQRYLRK